MKTSFSKDETTLLFEFLAETREHLDGIEEKILKLEVEKDSELINSIFRPIHTVKGTSSFLNIKNISHFSHEFETLLDDIRKNRITDIDSELIDIILESSDILSNMLNNLELSLNKADLNDDPVEIEVEDIEYKELLDRLIAIRSNKSNVSEELKPKQELSYDEIEPEQDISIDYSKVIIPKEIKQQFITEGRENLDSMESILLKLENRQASSDDPNELFRILHTLKGNVGVFLSLIEDEIIRKNHFLNKFRKLSHLAESIVQKIRDSKNEFIIDEIELLLKCKDFLNILMSDFEKNQNASVDITIILDEFKLYSESGSAKKTENINIINGDALSIAVSNNISQIIEAIEAGLIEISENEKRDKAIIKIIRSYKNLNKIGRKIKNEFLVSKSNSSLKIMTFLSLGIDENEEIFIDDLKNDLKILKEKSDRRKDIKKKDRRKKTLPQPLISPDKIDADKIGKQVIKVSQEKIDNFMNLIGELLVSKNNLNLLSKKLFESFGNTEIVNKIKEASDSISGISNDLQNNIMEIRMLPINIAFSKLPRMIRDLSKKLDKKIELKISGGDTEIDKNTIEALSDPFIHMLRNSADHGIEIPQIRLEKGKPEFGTIQLNAFNQGQNVIIQVIDDGRGIDAKIIKIKLLEKGMVTEKEFEEISDEQALNHIMMPGFSLAKEVSDVSGRGVGMDVVKSNIEKLGGEVIIESKIDIGTTFTIRLPLTMAIGRGLEVKIQKDRFYIPIEYIVETLKVKPANIFSYKSKLMTVIRKELIPIYRLETQLGMGKEIGVIKETIAQPVVVVNIKNQKIGLIVDNYYNESEYVVKPLTGNLSEIDGISGAMITGEGKVHLILDLLKLF